LRDQESEIRNQESGIRDQGSGIRNYEILNYHDVLLYIKYCISIEAVEKAVYNDFLLCVPL
jgi:hypothetical protein